MFSYFLIILAVLCTILPLLHIYVARKAASSYKLLAGFKPKTQRGMSILIPCYNEEGIISTSIHGLKQVQYDNKEIIFINDGSSDATMEILRDELDLFAVDRNPDRSLGYESVKGFYQSRKNNKVYVIDKENGGKADSLNAGADYASEELVVTLDADTVLKENALDLMNRAFQDDDVIAAGGMVHVLQGGRKATTMKNKLIVRLQILEYLKGFYIYKASLAKQNALAIISGAFGVFNREILLSVGGYRRTIGEDIDVTMKFQQYRLDHPRKKIVFMPHAIGYTECPENWRDLFKQRVRWQKAFIDCVVKYISVLTRTLFKRRLSFFFLVDSFLTGTVATVLTIVYLLLLPFLYGSDVWLVLSQYLVFSVALNIVYSIMALIISRKYGMHYKRQERWWWIRTILTDLMMFRFLYMIYIVFGTLLYFINKDGWNKVQRTGKEYYGTGKVLE